MEFLAFLAIAFPLLWTILLIVLVSRSGEVGEAVRRLQGLEGRLNRDALDLSQILARLDRLDQALQGRPPVVPSASAAAETHPPSATPAEAPLSPPTAAEARPPAVPDDRPLPPPPLWAPDTEAGRTDAETRPPASTDDMPLPPPPLWAPAPETGRTDAETRPPAVPDDLPLPPPPLWTPDAEAGRADAPAAATEARPPIAETPPARPAAEEPPSPRGRAVPSPLSVRVSIPAEPPVATEPGPLARASRAALDFLMREGHFWVAAGLLVLFLGATFLVRYTIAMGWFTPAMRLISTFLVGLALTGIGLAVRRRRQTWALAVQGGGLGLMYLTIVASVRVYELVGQSPALAVMTLLVVVTALLALWQNSQIVAHLSLVAAFVAPLLVSSGQNNFVGLFSFHTILNLGILGLVQVRPWRRLYLTGFTLSFGIFATWVQLWYQPPMFNGAAPFLIAFYLFYVFIGLRTAAGDGLASASAFSTEGRWPRFRTDLTLTVLAPVLFLSLMAAMADRPFILAGTAAGMGLLYLALGFGLRARHLPPLIAKVILWEALICLNLGLALFLFDRGQPWAGLSQWTILSLTWSLEGALLGFIGASQGKAEARVFSLICLSLAALFTLGALDTRLDAPSTGLVSQFFVASLVLGGAMIHAAWSRLNFSPDPEADRRRQPALLMLGVAAWTLGAVLETARLVDVFGSQFALAWLVTAGSLMSLVLLGLGRRLPILLTVGRVPRAEGDGTTEGPPFLVLAQGLVMILTLWQTLTGLSLFLFGTTPIPATDIDLFTGLAWGLMFLSQALAIAEARRYGPARLWANAWGLALAVIGGRVLLALAQAAHFPEAWWGPARLLPVLLLLAFFLRPPKRPLFEDLDFFRPLVCVLGGLSLWRFLVLIADPAAGPDFRPYVPVLNAVDFFQAASCVLPLATLYRHIWPALTDQRRWAIYALGILLFVWLNLVLGRSVHHYAGVPYEAAALFRSSHFQGACALVWGVVGIGTMITGHRAGRRLQWLLGAALMAMDLAKIFFIDLSRAGTVARIVSFVAVGLLLILVGYFAPLPPSETRKPEAEDGLTGGSPTVEAG